MTTIATRSQSSRSRLVAEVRRRLDGETFPRLIVLCMLLAAGAAAFFASVLALDAGVESMALRYALATAVGYVVFLLLIRVWIAVRRGWTPEPDDDVFGEGLELARRPDGAAGSGSSHGLVDAASDGFAWSFDLDDLWWLALIALAAFAGLVAVGFVVYAAPVLLAEVALDAALVGTVYRRLRREDRGYWATTALRQTWAAAAVLVAFMAVLGFALQQVAPEAVSVGDVIRRILAR
jgi:hypothetical protein